MLVSDRRPQFPRAAFDFAVGCAAAPLGAVGRASRGPLIAHPVQIFAGSFGLQRSRRGLPRLSVAHSHGTITPGSALILCNEHGDGGRTNRDKALKKDETPALIAPDKVSGTAVQRRLSRFANMHCKFRPKWR